MEGISSALDTARRLKNEAQASSDPNQAMRNFVSASKIYLREIENVNDSQFQAALAFLAKSSIYDAIVANPHSRSYQPAEADHDDSNLLIYCDRVIESVRQQRLHGLHKVVEWYRYHPFVTIPSFYSAYHLYCRFRKAMNLRLHKL